VHFEIIGRDPTALRRFYGELFDCDLGVGDASSPAVSDPGRYGFLDGATTVDPDAGAGSAAPNGGIGGGPGFTPHVVFYVGVDDVPSTLARAVDLGGAVAMAPQVRPDGALVVAHLTDPEGNLVGLAGPPA
jgi:predicted enzyme related to lactoylglutathione lyase